MHVQSLSHNDRIARLTRLTQQLMQSRSPADSLRILQSTLPDPHESAASLLLSTRGLSPGQFRIVGAHLPAAASGEAIASAMEESRLVREEGSLGNIIRRHEPQLAHGVDWSDDPCLRELLRDYSSVLAIPITGHHLTPSWLILLKKPPARFTAVEMEEAVERVALAGALLENQTLAEELAIANEQIDRDARRVGELQRALLPASLPRIVGLEIAASYLPMERAGGDLYDLFPLDGHPGEHGDDDATPGRWCVFIGDVAGHGLAAAIVMAIVHAVLHAHPPGLATPASLLMHVNRQLCDKRFGHLFATAFLGVYDSRSRRLTYACAGHPAPLLKRMSDGSIHALDAVASCPLGLVDSETFEEATVELDCGDILLLFTDGIIEAQNAAREQFGNDRLKYAFRLGGFHPEPLIDRLREVVRAHEQAEAVKDDQTLVVVQVRPNQPITQPTTTRAAGGRELAANEAACPAM